MVSTPYVEPVRNCHNCGASLPLGALACDQCHSLVHSEELIRISTRAKALEEQDQLLRLVKNGSRPFPSFLPALRKPSGFAARLTNLNSQRRLLLLRKKSTVGLASLVLLLPSPSSWQRAR